jgi:hypothetical protein
MRFLKKRKTAGEGCHHSGIPILKDAPLTPPVEASGLLDYKFEQYFRKEIAEGRSNFSLKAQINSDDTITFYIRPSGKRGRTYNYRVTGDKAAFILGWSDLIQ